jgi:hypothetical protein
MHLTLDELDCLRGSEDLRRKLDEILALIKEKGADIKHSRYVLYENGTLILDLSVLIPLKN